MGVLNRTVSYYNGPATAGANSTGNGTAAGSGGLFVDNFNITYADGIVYFPDLTADYIVYSYQDESHYVVV